MAFFIVRFENLFIHEYAYVNLLRLWLISKINESFFFLLSKFELKNRKIVTVKGMVVCFLGNTNWHLYTNNYRLMLSSVWWDWTDKYLPLFCMFFVSSSRFRLWNWNFISLNYEIFFFVFEMSILNRMSNSNG